MGIVDVLTSLGSGVAEMFVSVLETLSTVFFTVGDNGITITALGYIALIGLVLSIVWKLFNFVKGLISRR